MPPYLAGRTEEQEEFGKLLDQDIILQNVVLTGLRGVGKTVLLETLKPEAIERGWLWVGTDMSESATVDEQSMAVRLITDMAVTTANFAVGTVATRAFGFDRSVSHEQLMLDYNTLWAVFDRTPGLIADKLKAVLELVWSAVPTTGYRGLVFAYDEAQNLGDRAEKDQYPLSMLLDVFQSIQKKGVRFMLALTGLPTLYPKLVEARTFAERMFRVISLDKLDIAASRQAITIPVAKAPRKFADASVETIIDLSGGYPYFIQFICREVYDVWIRQIASGHEPAVPVNEIQRKLDSDLFAGRWARVTDRQRELLTVIARLDTAESEFTVQEVVELSSSILTKPFSASHVNQMLNTLTESDLIYKNRRGKYSLAVPLLNRFILRQLRQSQPTLWP
ncbi:MAG: AAA family ATPase [Phycisphaerales bacterium]